MTTMQAELSIADVTIQFPNVDSNLDQHEEWCLVERDGETEKIRFHDYHRIYETPGLYEAIFYEHLKCISPEVVCGQLKHELEAEGFVPEECAALDVGAGNGMVAEKLKEFGFRTAVGIDIIPEAKMAALRDRPDVYEDYHVEDLTDLPEPVLESLREHEFNCLTTVAALGFNDIPTAAFSTAYNLVQDGGLIAFNIRDKFLDDTDATGFQKLIQDMKKEGILDLRRAHTYTHRKDIEGNPLNYVAIVGKKMADIPERLITN